MGVISPLGCDVDAFWASCVAGRSAVRQIAAFDASNLPSRIAGEVRGFQPQRHMSEKLIGRTDRFTQFAIASANEALHHSGAIGAVQPERLGIVLGNGGGGLGVIGNYPQIFIDKVWDTSDRLALLKLLPDAAASNLAILTGAKGPVMTLVAACVSSTQAIGEAVRLIRHDEADVVLAGGTEAGVTFSGMIGFCLLRALSTRNGQPERASRPFDSGRDGFVLAEGAAMLAIEELEHALSRGAPILAEISGYAQTCDAHHLVIPERNGTEAARCIEHALGDASIDAADVDYISAHGTSTPHNDVAETRAIKSAFGERAARVPISSLKSMMGHALGATGAIETIAAVMALKSDVVPPTINFEKPDPQCDLDYVPNKARSLPVRVVLKNSFGFGGQNACLVLTRFAA